MIVNANGNVDVQLSNTLLWINSEPHSYFPPQAIYLDDELDKYTMLHIMYTPSPDIEYPITATVHVNSDLSEQRLYYYFGDDSYHRKVTVSIYDMFVYFDEGAYSEVSGNTGTSGTNDHYIIPYCIYGS